MAPESLQGIKAGMEVAIVPGDNWEQMAIARVQKVSPTGRFTVSWGAGSLHFNANGLERTSRDWHRKTMLPLTEERRRAIIYAQERAKLAYQMRHFGWGGVSLETLRAVAALLAPADREEG